MEEVKDSESRPHKAVSFVVESERRCRNGASRRCRRRCQPAAEAGCQEETQKKKGREEGEPNDGRKERKVWSEITQEVVASIKEEASAQGNAKSIAHRTVGQKVRSNCDCSQIEHEEEEEEKDWQEEDQMVGQWDEEHKLEEISERRRMEGNSLQLEVMQKVPELAVHERMTKGNEVRGTKGKKRESMVCGKNERQSK